MVKVNLKNPFFGPDGNLYPEGVHDFPSDWTLPKGAKAVEEEPAEEEPKPAKPAK